MHGQLSTSASGRGVARPGRMSAMELEVGYLTGEESRDVSLSLFLYPPAKYFID